MLAPQLSVVSSSSGLTRTATVQGSALGWRTCPDTDWGVGHGSSVAPGRPLSDGPVPPFVYPQRTCEVVSTTRAAVRLKRGGGTHCVPPPANG